MSHEDFLLDMKKMLRRQIPYKLMKREKRDILQRKCKSFFVLTPSRVSGRSRHLDAKYFVEKI